MSDRVYTLKLTEEEAMYLIMGWDALKKTKSYRQHVGLATFVRLKLQNALDYGHLENPKQ